MKISVIIPVFNYEHYISETINSVECQEGPFELEIIAIDDGSTDNSLAVLEALADQKGSHLQVVHRKNGGPSAARNEGIRHATGDAVLFLDADDLLAPGCLREQADILLKMPEVDVTIGNCLIFDKDKRKIDMWGLCKDSHALHLCASNIAPVHCFLARRNLIEDVGFFDETLPSLEDYDYWLRVAAHNKLFYTNSNALVLYRKHALSVSTNAKVMADFERQVLQRAGELINEAATSGTNFPPQGFFAGYVVQAAALLSQAIAGGTIETDLMRRASLALCKALRFPVSDAVRNSDVVRLYLFQLRCHVQRFGAGAEVSDAVNAVLTRMPDISRLPLGQETHNALFELTCVPAAQREDLARKYLASKDALIKLMQ